MTIILSTEDKLEWCSRQRYKRKCIHSWCRIFQQARSKWHGYHNRFVLITYNKLSLCHATFGSLLSLDYDMIFDFCYRTRNSLYRDNKPVFTKINDLQQKFTTQTFGDLHILDGSKWFLHRFVWWFWQLSFQNCQWFRVREKYTLDWSDHVY